MSPVDCQRTSTNHFYVSFKCPFVFLTCYFYDISHSTCIQKNVFPNFQSILRLRLWVKHILLLLCCMGHYVGNIVNMINKQFDRLFCQTNEFEQNILHINIIPKGFCWCKNLNFFEKKWEDEAVDHKMDLGYWNTTRHMSFLCMVWKHCA